MAGTQRAGRVRGTMDDRLFFPRTACSYAMYIIMAKSNRSENKTSGLGDRVRWKCYRLARCKGKMCTRRVKSQVANEIGKIDILCSGN